MPYRIDIDKEKDALHIALAGTMNSSDVENLAKTISENDACPPDMRVLVDLRQLNFENIDTDFIWRVIAMEKLYPYKGITKTALIADSNVGFGMMRMYVSLTNDESRNIMIFRNYSEGEEWLLSPVNAARI